MLHGVDFYLAWCKSNNYIPIALKVMGSHMFGTNTPSTKDIDFYGVHIQPPVDFLGMDSFPRLIHHFEYEVNGITYEYKSMDIKHLYLMLRKGSINEILWLFKGPNTLSYDRIYNDMLYHELKMVACYHLPLTLGKAVFGMMDDNYQKYITNRSEKDHKLYKKFLHIFCTGWAYYRLLFKLAHTHIGFYHYKDIDFKLPKLVSCQRQFKHLIHHKSQQRRLSDTEVSGYSFLFLKFRTWLQQQEEKYKQNVQLETSPMSDELLMNTRLALFD